MTIYSSKSSKGFFDDEIHSEIPPDAIEISKELHLSLLEAQSSNKVIDFSGAIPKIVDYSSLISLGDLKEERRQYINIERNRVLQLGFQFKGFTFDCDDISLSRISSIVTATLAGIPLPENFTWRSKDNQNVPMTLEELIQFGATALAHLNTIMQRSWALRDYISTRTTKSKVSQINWDTEI